MSLVDYYYDFPWLEGAIYRLYKNIGILEDPDMDFGNAIELLFSKYSPQLEEYLMDFFNAVLHSQEILDIKQNKYDEIHLAMYPIVRIIGQYFSNNVLNNAIGNIYAKTFYHQIEVIRKRSNHRAFIYRLLVNIAQNLDFNCIQNTDDPSKRRTSKFRTYFKNLPFCVYYIDYLKISSRLKDTR